MYICRGVSRGGFVINCIVLTQFKMPPLTRSSLTLMVFVEEINFDSLCINIQGHTRFIMVWDRDKEIIFFPPFTWTFLLTFFGPCKYKALKAGFKNTKHIHRVYKELKQFEPPTAEL